MSDPRSQKLPEKNLPTHETSKAPRKKDRRVIWLLIIWGSLFFGIILMYWLAG